MMPRVWTCQRTTAGERCGHQNPARKRLCETCGKPKPTRKRPAHMAALDLPYEHYIKVNGGNHCGICRAKPKPSRRLDRDHEHKAGGKPRGLLCFRCNAALRDYMTLDWMRAAVAYLECTE